MGEYITIELDNGGKIEQWVNPPPTPTHKTKGINAIEWRRLFLPDDPYLIDELRDNISNMTYSVSKGAVTLDSPASAINLTITYRQFLRTCFKAFEEATSGSNSKGIDADDVLTYPSLICFEALGIIAPGRKEVIIQGVPLQEITMATKSKGDKSGTKVKVRK